MIIMIKKNEGNKLLDGRTGNDLVLTMSMTKTHLKATNSSIVGLAMM